MSEVELQQKQDMYEHTIHEEQCFSSEDVRRLAQIRNELSQRQTAR